MRFLAAAGSATGPQGHPRWNLQDRTQTPPREQAQAAAAAEEEAGKGAVPLAQTRAARLLAAHLQVDALQSARPRAALPQPAGPSPRSSCMNPSLISSPHWSPPTSTEARFRARRRVAAAEEVARLTQMESLEWRRFAVFGLLIHLGSQAAPAAYLLLAPATAVGSLLRS